VPTLTSVGVTPGSAACTRGALQSIQAKAISTMDMLRKLFIRFLLFLPCVG
jgi:hypothetical protein